MLMTNLKNNLKLAPYGVATILGVFGLIFLVPGGLLILGAIAMATWGDKLTSYEWKDR